MHASGRRGSDYYGFLRDLFSGGLSGIVAKTVAAPIERVKLLLQTQQVNRGVSVQYKDSFDCFSRVYREQGLQSFWRGNVANLLRYFPSQALSFAFKDLYRDALGVSEGGKNDNRASMWFLVWGNLAAAGAAGGTSLVLLYPLEMARTLQAADVSIIGERRKFAGTIHCLRHLYAENGLPGWYAGLPVSIFGVVVFRGLYMGGYDITKSLLGLNRNSANSSTGGITDVRHYNLLSRLGAAQLVTTVAGTLCYPLDTVRRRMMMQTREETISVSGNIRSAQPYYRNTWHCLVRILREEGPRGLFRGLGANLVRGMSGSLLLVGYDEVRGFFDRQFSG